MIPVPLLDYYHIPATVVKAPDPSCDLERAVRNDKAAFPDALVQPWRSVFTDPVKINLINPYTGKRQGGIEGLGKWNSLLSYGVGRVGRRQGQAVAGWLGSVVPRRRAGPQAWKEKQGQEKTRNHDGR